MERIALDRRDGKERSAAIAFQTLNTAAERADKAKRLDENRPTEIVADRSQIEVRIDQLQDRLKKVISVSRPAITDDRSA